jgi:hypothetical protein
VHKDLPNNTTNTTSNALPSAPSFEIPPLPSLDAIWLPGDHTAAAKKSVQLPPNLSAQIRASLTCVLDNLRLITTNKTRDVFQEAYLKVSDAHTNLKYLLGLVASSNIDPAIASIDAKITQIIDLSNAVLMACFDIDTEEGDFAKRAETPSIHNIAVLVNDVLSLC